MAVEQDILNKTIDEIEEGKIIVPKGLAAMLVRRVIRGLETKNRIDSGEYGTDWTSSPDNGAVKLDIPAQKGGLKFGLRQGILKQVVSDSELLAELGYGATIAQVLTRDRYLHGVVVSPVTQTPVLQEADRILGRDI